MRGGDAGAGALSGRPSRHESFLAFRHYRYLGAAALLSAASLALYILDRPFGSRYGGTWAGYTLGIGGALLILWLTWFGYRKRSYAKVEGRLVERLSAHVYLGMALAVIATLHTGFHFGWNVHTLAYALMCVVIASGLCGVFCYARYPRLMTANRAGMTLQQMLASIATLDEQLRVAALPLDETAAMVVERAIETNAIGGSAWRQMSRHYPNCTTAAAVVHFEAGTDAMTQFEPGDAAVTQLDLDADAVVRLEPGADAAVQPALDADATDDSLKATWSQVRVLLDEKAALLVRVRRDISYKAMIDFWLYFHVPVSVMLLAALFAHIVSVFFLW